MTMDVVGSRLLCVQYLSEEQVSESGTAEKLDSDQAGTLQEQPQESSSHSTARGAEHPQLLQLRTNHIITSQSHANQSALQCFAVNNFRFCNCDPL